MKERNIKSWRKAVIGFIGGAIPVGIVNLETMISEQYSLAFLYKILKDLVTYGIIGSLVGISYFYVYPKFPRLSRYVLITLVFLYYLYFALFLIVAIYVDSVGRIA